MFNCLMPATGYMDRTYLAKRSKSSCVNVLENVRLAWFGNIAMVPRRRAVLQEIGQSYV
jgi:hypothetical protein